LRVLARSILVGHGVKDVRTRRRCRKRQFDNFLKRHRFGRDHFLLAVDDDGEFARLRRTTVKVFVLAQVNRVIIVFNDGVFLVAPYLAEKVITGLDAAKLVESLTRRRVRRLVGFLVNVDADLMFLLVIFHYVSPLLTRCTD